MFYFGNAIGESGNSTSDAKVNAFDMLGARNNLRTFLDQVPIDFKFDYNRDQRVNVFDMLIARNNQTHFLNALRLITAPAGKGIIGAESGMPVQFANNAAASTIKLDTAGDAPRTKMHRLFDTILGQSDQQEPERRDFSTGGLVVCPD